MTMGLCVSYDSAHFKENCLTHAKEMLELMYSNININLAGYFRKKYMSNKNWIESLFHYRITETI